MKKLLPTLALFLFLIAGFSVRAGEDDPLHKREFNASLSETRNGAVQKKVIPDLIHFKDGKVQSDFLKEKFGFRSIRYRINTDTTYIDSTGAEVRLLKIEASATDEENVTVQILLTSLEWDLDGVIRITKNDRLRKYYDVAAREKGGKPRKVKRKDREETPEGEESRI